MHDCVRGELSVVAFDVGDVGVHEQAVGDDAEVGPDPKCGVEDAEGISVLALKEKKLNFIWTRAPNTKKRPNSPRIDQGFMKS